MFPRIFRYLALPAPSSAVLRAGALCGVLTLLLIVIKLLRIPSGGTSGLFGSTLIHDAWAFALGSFDGKVSPRLLASATLVALLVYMLARRTVWRYAISTAVIVALPLVYAGTVAAGVLTGDEDPWYSMMFVRAPDELGIFFGLWWPEILVVAVLFALLSACYSAPAHLERPARRVAAVLVGIVFALVGLDFAYYIATRTELTADEVIYAISFPRDALIAAEDGGSVVVVWAIGFVIAMLVAGLVLARLVGARNPVRKDVKTGWAVWPALALVVVAPEAPAERELQQFADNAVTRFSADLIVRPVVNLATASRKIAPSNRVPRLEGAPVTASVTSRTRPYNVVMILMESVRADATSVYASHRDTTPFLAELARESLVVDRMYSVVPRTSASWIATIGGRYPAPVTVLRRWSTQREVPPIDSSLVRLLRTQGYVSAWFSPARMDFENEPQILRALGFDHVFSDADLGLDAKSRINSFGHDDRLILPPLDRWLDERQREQKPFFLTVMTNAAHYPYRLPADVSVPVFAGRTPEQTQYLRCVAYLDTVMRQIVNSLRQRELLEQSIVVVLGDHGDAFFEHGDFTHFRVVYEEALHVPMLIRLPAELDRRGRIRGLHQQIDIMPTVLDALGLELNGGPLPGRSVLSDDGARRPLFFSTHFDKTAVAMRDGNLKYIYSFGHRPLEVYDLERDPTEQSNLSQTLSAETRQQAEADLLEWRRRVRASFTPGGSH